MNKNQTAAERRAILQTISDALIEQSYDPIRQISGYLLTEDPTYIPNHRNARALIVEIDRADLLDDLLRSYLEPERKAATP